MVIQHPLAILVLLYCFISIVAFKRCAKKAATLELGKRAEKVLLTIVLMLLVSWATYCVGEEVKDKWYLVAMLCYVSVALLDLGAILIFAWYSFKKASMIFDFVILLLRYGPNEAEDIVIRRLQNRRGDKEETRLEQP